MNDQSIISRNEDWLSTWVGDNLVMMSSEQGFYISLTETGGRIWELLETPHGLAELCQALAEEYEITAAESRSDVVKFLQQMRGKNAIHVDTSALP